VTTRQDDDPRDRPGHHHQALSGTASADRRHRGGAFLQGRGGSRRARLGADLGQFSAAQWVKSRWPSYVEGCAQAERPADAANWRVAKSIFVTDDDDALANRYAHTAEGPYHFYFKQLIRKLVGFCWSIQPLQAGSVRAGRVDHGGHGRAEARDCRLGQQRGRPDPRVS
jgi:hypothetical protein